MSGLESAFLRSRRRRLAVFAPRADVLRPAIVVGTVTARSEPLSGSDGSRMHGGRCGKCIGVA
jgi:hypothetical protein